MRPLLHRTSVPYLSGLSRILAHPPGHPDRSCGCSSAPSSLVSTSVRAMSCRTGAHTLTFKLLLSLDAPHVDAIASSSPFRLAGLGLGSPSRCSSPLDAFASSSPFRLAGLGLGSPSRCSFPMDAFSLTLARPYVDWPSSLWSTPPLAGYAHPRAAFAKAAASFSSASFLKAAGVSSTALFELVAYSMDISNFFAANHFVRKSAGFSSSVTCRT